MDDRVRRMRRGGLVALAGLVALVTLAVVGCSGSSKSPAHSPARNVGTGGLVIPSGSVQSSTQEPLGTGRRSGVTGGALFGGDVPLVGQQGKLGRKLAIVRDYYRMGETFPSSRDRVLMAHGTTLLVSLDTVPPKGPLYASIAAGSQDAYISRFLRSVEQSAVRYHLAAIYITFEHEADTAPHHAGLGSPAQFVRAWDHVHRLAVAAHLDWNQGGRLHWAWLLTSVAFRKGLASQFWPGSNEVDIVAADGYNAGTCRLAQGGTNVVDTSRKVLTPGGLFNAVVGFAHGHGGLPVFIAEWASVPYSWWAVQPAFIRSMQSYVTQNREIAAALYWNDHGQGNGCDYILDRNQASLSALAGMARSAALQGRVG